MFQIFKNNNLFMLMSSNLSTNQRAQNLHIEPMQAHNKIVRYLNRVKIFWKFHILMLPCKERRQYHPLTAQQEYAPGTKDTRHSLWVASYSLRKAQGNKILAVHCVQSVSSMIEMVALQSKEFQFEIFHHEGHIIPSHFSVANEHPLCVEVEDWIVH